VSKPPERDFVGTRYRTWIASLSHERLLPTRRRTMAVFAVAYAITFVWRALTTTPLPFLFGLFVTILLTATDAVGRAGTWHELVPLSGLKPLPQALGRIGGWTSKSHLQRFPMLGGHCGSGFSRDRDRRCLQHRLRP